MESVLFYHHMNLEAQSQAVKFAQQVHYPLSTLALSQPPHTKKSSK